MNLIDRFRYIAYSKDQSIKLTVNVKDLFFFQQSFMIDHLQGPIHYSVKSSQSIKLIENFEDLVHQSVMVRFQLIKLIEYSQEIVDYSE